MMMWLIPSFPWPCFMSEKNVYWRSLRCTWPRARWCWFKHIYWIEQLKGKTEAALQTIFNLAGNKNFNQIEMKTIWKLVETCILPIILYAAETWIPTKGEVEQIQKILDNILKRILQTPLTTPSEIIQLETGIWDIETMIEEKQIMYYHRIHNNPAGITSTTASVTKNPWNIIINNTIKKHNMDHDTIVNKKKSQLKHQIKSILNKKWTKSSHKATINQK